VLSWRAGAWGADVVADVAIGDQLRAEVAPLTQRYRQGTYSLQDLAGACQALAAGQPSAAAGRGAELATALMGAPLGRVLMVHAAVTPVALGFGGSEYGR
jgi:hypothetical protein